MTHSDDERAEHAHEVHPPPARPRAANWFWRPWYAKIWWITAGIFWVAIFCIPKALISESVISPIMILFHPFFIVPTLGYGFFKAWIRQNFHTELSFDVEPDVSRRELHGSLSFRMDPTDPTDSSYYGHPGNPMSEAWRNEHVRGIH